MTTRSRAVKSSQPAASATVDIVALADRVQAGETVTAPSVEAAGELLQELSRRGRTRQASEWYGNTLRIFVGTNTA